MKPARSVIALTVLLALIIAFRTFSSKRSAVSEVAVPTVRRALEKIEIWRSPQATSEVAFSTAKDSGLKPVKSWAFLGSATPKSAFESLFWAKENLDTITLTSILSVPPEALQRADQVLLSMSLPARSRLNIHTPEALIAYLYATSPVIRGIRIVAEHERDLQNASIDGEVEFETGHKAAVQLGFRLEPGGWRYVIDGKSARDMLDQWQKVWTPHEK